MIAVGNGFTVIALVEKQPLAKVYVMVLVPAVTPVTLLAVPNIAALVPELLHNPPPGLHPRVVVAPSHKEVAPLIEPGFELIVTVAVAKQPAPNV